MRNRLSSIILSVAALLTSGCNIGSTGMGLDTASYVDVERYMGKWYEIAKYPVPFEAGCYGVTAEYTLLQDGRVRVVNECRSSDGTRVINRIEGFATVEDKTSNSKLSVTFFSPFAAPYWILEVATNYEYAVVGDPTRSTLWILSRTPTLDDATYQEILGRLPSKGYDPGRLEPMIQFQDAAP